jgi:hypothetical protein
MSFFAVVAITFSTTFENVPPNGDLVYINTTNINAQIALLSPVIGNYEIDSSSPPFTKNTNVAFDLTAGQITTTDMITFETDPPQTDGGTIQIYDPGLNFVTLIITITLDNSTGIIPNGYVITGLGAPISGTLGFGFFDPTSTTFYERTVQILVDSLCLHGDSIVHTSTGNIKISDLKSDSGAHLVGINGESIKLISNLCLPPVSKFVLISKGSIANNSPSEDMYIIDGHPVCIDGKEVLPSKLVNNLNIKYVNLDPVPVYTLVTETRTYVLINNIAVCTWSLEDITNRLSATFIHTKN